MKKLIILLLIVGISYGSGLGWQSGVPTWLKFGVNPTGSITMNGDTLIVDGKITSPLATSYQYFASSATADSIVWVQTGTAGDRDMVNKYVEDDGTVHNWRWDDAADYWYLDDLVRSLSGFRVGNVYLLSTKLESTDVAFLLDVKVGATGTLTIGDDGDHDINYLNSRLRTNITTVAAAYTMGASDGYMYTMTANDTLRCPTTPLAGEVLMCKFTHASGGWVKGMGNTIDGAANVATSENDNVVIVWNSSTSDWEIR